MKVSEVGLKSENEKFSKLKKMKVKIFTDPRNKSGRQGDVKVGEASMKSESDNRKSENQIKRVRVFCVKA